MKMTKICVGVVGAIALAFNAFATAPATSASSANVDATVDQFTSAMNQEAKKIAQAISKDQHQDAEGQQKLDKAWAKLWSDLGQTPPYPDPYTYEGSNKDNAQDAKLLDKLNDWLAHHHLPPVSSCE